MKKDSHRFIPKRANGAAFCTIRTLLSYFVLLALAVISGTASAQIVSPSSQTKAETITVLPAGPISSSRANANGVRIHYLKAGNGPAIVLLHGWASTSSMWRNVIGPLSKTHTVIAPDLRGYGGSSKVLEWFDQREVAADIQALMKSQGISNYVVVGFDLGAHVAFHLAASSPQEVSALVLVDSVIPGFAPWEGLTRDPRLWHWSFYSVPDLPETLISGNERNYFSWFMKNFAVNHLAVDAEIPRVVEEFTGVGAIRGALQLFRARNTAADLNSAWAKQNRLRMPVMAIGGEGGTGSTLFDQMSTVGDHVEGAVFRGCGHWIVVECSDAFLSRMTLFLSRQR